MEIIITEEAVRWYKDELELSDPSYIRFHVRYGGIGGNIPGFSLGISLEEPSQIHTSIEVDFITFYIEDSDAWYFDDKNLNISFNEKMNEPQFAYITA